MAHFARLDESNVVTMIAVISNDDMIDENGLEVEALGIAVCETVIGPGPWVQTSYNNNQRTRYAGVGYTYDASHDAFIPPKPFPSWELSDDLNWEPPIIEPEPTDIDYHWSWNEELGAWENLPNENPVPEADVPVIG